MKRLTLLRHADANAARLDQADAERPLSARGRSEASAQARALAEADFQVDLVLCSPARRARETQEALRAASARPWPARFPEPLYLATPTTLLATLQDLPDALSAVLVVGHNPGLHELARTLAGSTAPEAAVRASQVLSTGTLMRLRCDVARWSELAPACARLCRVVKPGERIA